MSGLPLAVWYIRWLKQENSGPECANSIKGVVAVWTLDWVVWIEKCTPGAFAYSLQLLAKPGRSSPSKVPEAKTPGHRKWKTWLTHQLDDHWAREWWHFLLTFHSLKLTFFCIFSFINYNLHIFFLHFLIFQKKKIILYKKGSTQKWLGGSSYCFEKEWKNTV